MGPASPTYQISGITFLQEERMSTLQLYFTLHMIGLSIWVGQALLLPIVIVPAVRALEAAGQMKFMEVFTRKYIPWFIGAAVVVIITGVLQMFDPNLAEEMFGESATKLILKHAVVIPLLATTIYQWFFLGKKLGKADTDKEKLWGQFKVFSWVQLTLAVAVLVITGILTG
jgi:uncharacterized membrane protein